MPLSTALPTTSSFPTSLGGRTIGWWCRRGSGWAAATMGCCWSCKKCSSSLTCLRKMGVCTRAEVHLGSFTAQIWPSSVSGLIDCMYVSVSTCMCACVYAYMCIYNAHVSVCTCICVHMYLCAYVLFRLSYWHANFYCRLARAIND